MCNENQNAGKVLIGKLPPKALIKPTHTIIRIRRRLPIRYPIKEVSVRRPLMPHPLHLSRARLKIAEILFADPRLLVNLDLVCIRMSRQL